MKFVIGLFFIVIAMVLLGLLLTSRGLFKAKPSESAEKFWAWALGLDVVGLFLFGVYMATATDFNQTMFIGTVANTAMLMAYVYQALNIRGLRKPILPQTKWLSVALVLAVGVAWHFGKAYSTPDGRAFFMAAATACVFVWQILEIHQGRVLFAELSAMRMLTYFVALELVLTLVRVAIFSGQLGMLTVQQIPAAVMVAVWLQMGLKVLSYDVLKGYWQEELAKAQQRTELENVQFKALTTKQEKIIADLGRLNKAATAGILTASVAHELTQPLQAASLNAEMLQDMLKAEPPDVAAALELLNYQHDDLQRMALIVKTMRGVFSESGSHSQILDVFVLFKNLDLLLNAQAHKRGITIEYRHVGDTQVKAHASELQQVALNIIGNAFDALLAHKVAQPLVRISVMQVQKQVVCTIEDNGPGIAPELEKEVFKILKTTKSEGMGLGLWLARYITERNGGQIAVDRSELGGARFTLSFASAQA